MRRMASAFINRADGLIVGRHRVSDTCDNAHAHQRCQECIGLVFLRREIDDANAAASGFYQFLHLGRVRLANRGLVLGALLFSTDEWALQTQACDLSSYRNWPAFDSFGQLAYSPHCPGAVNRCDGGKERRYTRLDRKS